MGKPSTLEVGQTHGYLTLVEQTTDKDKHNRFMWRCRCHCGNEKIVSSSGIRRGASCGCVNYSRHDATSLVGKRYGRLEVIKRLRLNENRQYSVYLCRCDCGLEKEMTSKNLSGGTKSCGCLAKEIGIAKLPPGEAAFNTLLTSYKAGAKNRNFEFCLETDQFRFLTQQNCVYCGRQPSQKTKQPGMNGHYVYNGIDRVDSKKGYTVENCVSCCKTCNIMKMGLSREEFLSHLHRIIGHTEGG